VATYCAFALVFAKNNKISDFAQSNGSGVPAVELEVFYRSEFAASACRESACALAHLDAPYFEALLRFRLFALRRIVAEKRGVSGKNYSGPMIERAG
jgi:hypothetical protein